MREARGLDLREKAGDLYQVYTIAIVAANQRVVMPRFQPDVAVALCES